ncbi:MAG TPA: class I SAM-dependent methyltransferase [Ktedonobacterales bacterium]|nr:class I SAM-dependent methyltransferase [Ktedonobacterales bacterium]
MATTEIIDTFSYEPFTQHAFYHEVNQGLVRQALAHLPATAHDQPLCIVDLACGTGAISELVLQELSCLGRSARLIGIDSSAKALERAALRLAGAAVTFVLSNLSDLTPVIDHADLIFFCNAVHLIPQKEALLTRLAQVLHPGGLLACNTTFFDGAYVQGTESYYRLSIRRALEYLRREYPGVRPSRQERAQAMDWLTADTYRHLLVSAGFQPRAFGMHQANLPVQAWRDIGSYSEFIEGALPGIPLPLGALALRAAADQVFSEMNLSFIPRYWLQIVAAR